jgi:hypothetical protein
MEHHYKAQWEFVVVNSHQEFVEWSYSMKLNNNNLVLILGVVMIKSELIFKCQVTLPLPESAF